MARITLPAALTLAFLAAGLPYVLLRFTGRDAAAAILAEILFVQSFLDLRVHYTIHRGTDRMAAGLFRKKAGRLRGGRSRA